MDGVAYPDAMIGARPVCQANNQDQEENENEGALSNAQIGDVHDGETTPR
jgi:hypothetical protein